MSSINYRSDLDFMLPYPMWTEGEDGKPAIKDIGFPEFDFEVRLWTARRGRSIEVACVGGRCRNCFNDGGRIHVVCNSHGLTPGRLMADYHSMLPNAIYPDGVRDVFRPMELDVELVAGAGDCLTEVEVEAVLPVIKGKDAYTYAVEHGYEGTEAEFGQALAKVSDKQDSLEVSEDLSLSDGRLSVTERAKREVFNDMWAAIGGVWLDNGKYRIGADGKELTYEEAVLRYERDGFIRQYNEACMEKSSSGRVSALWGGYNEATGYFERYSATDKILDIGIDEARVMYDAYVSGGGYGNARANIPRHTFYNYMHYLTDPTRFTNTCLELVDEKYLSCYTGNTAGAVGCRILNSHDLRELRTIWLSTYTGNKVYIQSRNLEYIGFAQQNDPTPMPFSEFFIGNASKFRLDGIRVVVRYVRDSTVTVHKDVYAKLTGDTTNEAAAALSEEEAAQWQQVFTDATAKNITFATT